MLDFNIVYLVLIALGAFLFIRYGKPYLKANNLDYYEEVKLFLLLSGFAFRDEKIKAMADVALEIVTKLEEASLAPDEKHNIALAKLIRDFIDELSIEIDTEVLEGVIRIAVSKLEPTTGRVDK